METFDKLLKELKEYSTSTRSQGDKFEHLMLNYLKTDPLYKQKYKEVWLWNNFPLRNNKVDTGIDLVAQERETEEYCAIQCKFYDSAYTLQKGDIDSFFTASGKSIYSSRIVISTTDKWSKHAEDALENQRTPVTRIRLQDLSKSSIDWSEYSLDNPQKMELKEKKKLRPHQKEALENVLNGFKENNRGQLIMACGTGKTFTSLKIAETLAEESLEKHYKVLFLVPSISLLSQTLREWTGESELGFQSYAVCSDKGVTNQSEDINSHDLGFPATTKADELHKQFKLSGNSKKMSVIFSTYHSIEVVSEAQKKGLDEFDLIICDEAHRTTGVTLNGENESHFVSVHNQEYIKSKKRIYMTATPKLFNDDSKTKANEHNALLCSMDNEEVFGKEFHRLGFGEAVGKGLLTDYKVIVLAVDEKHISSTFQKQIANSDSEITLDDAVKITGCWNGLSKRMSNEFSNSAKPMKRAVAFSRSIKDSKKITQLFSYVVDEYIQLNADNEENLRCEADHVDGTFNALKRNEKLDWLKEDTGDENVCRILSNARCLTEGVDVPDLDAVMFLNPRNSVVDVVQAVGRVMRKSEGKDYGYIILPIGVPTGMPPEEALNNNQKYKVVWQVLQALRAHDDRFNTTVNQIELNKKRPNNVEIIGVGEKNNEGKDGKSYQLELNFPDLEEWRDAIYAKIVQKCGDRRYWENWASDVAKIAERHFMRIKLLLEDPNSEHKKIFNSFLKELQDNLNEGIGEDEAIEMLSQHMITKPVFDALFDEYSFVKSNPVSIAMQHMIEVLEKQSFEKETETLESFYQSVRERAKGIDNATAKQKIITELYDKFFKNAFPKTTERLGIVYTPIEIVDFIISSVNEALIKEFQISLSEENVHILDPFTGTGTFIVRLLQSGLIRPEDLLRKYTQELHANEIVLLAYYIAAINIEEVFHGLKTEEYIPFKGVVLTDTFQLNESKENFSSVIFPENNVRVANQSSKDIRVIMGNPPYSAKQSSENEGNKNIKYPQLDESIRSSYVKNSSAINKNNLYDSYIRSIRWASDRIKEKGIVCFVTNGSFINGGAMDGLRKSLEEEFTSIYCFNLRGNARGSGEARRKEGGNVFGAGTRTTIAITMFIKNPDKKDKCTIYYHDIGDYLNQEEKLETVKQAKNIFEIDWEKITPNATNDWINQRDIKFETFIPLGNKKEKNIETIFENYSRGLESARDTWVYNFSKSVLEDNVKRMINFYNTQVEDYEKVLQTSNKPINIDKFVENNPKMIKWSSSLKQRLNRLQKIQYDSESLTIGMYRPFVKKWVYYNGSLIHRVGQLPKIFPMTGEENLMIYINGSGAGKDFSALIVDLIPDLNMNHSGGQGFPMYTYEIEENLGGLFDEPSSKRVVRNDNITNNTLQNFKNIYGEELTKEDIFYYVYGILHSKEYKERFLADLQKMLPRIPYAKEFRAFCEGGRKLAALHLNYESLKPYPLKEIITSNTQETFEATKIKYGTANKTVDKSVLIINSYVTLKGVPMEAYDYHINGRSAIEWIIDQYKVDYDKDSQINNNPNDWSKDNRYIIDLVKRIVTLSVETLEIVNSFPPIQEIDVK